MPLTNNFIAHQLPNFCSGWHVDVLLRHAWLTSNTSGCTFSTVMKFGRPGKDCFCCTCKPPWLFRLVMRSLEGDRGESMAEPAKEMKATLAACGEPDSSPDDAPAAGIDSKPPPYELDGLCLGLLLLVAVLRGLYACCTNCSCCACRGCWSVAASAG